jgi:hypothetical protein
MRRQIRTVSLSESDKDEILGDVVAVKKFIQTRRHNILIQDAENGVWYMGLREHLVSETDPTYLKPIFTEIVLDSDDEIEAHGVSDTLIYFKTKKGKLYVAAQFDDARETDEVESETSERIRRQTLQTVHQSDSDSEDNYENQEFPEPRRFSPRFTAEYTRVTRDEDQRRRQHAEEFDRAIAEDFARIERQYLSERSDMVVATPRRNSSERPSVRRAQHISSIVDFDIEGAFNQHLDENSSNASEENTFDEHADDKSLDLESEIKTDTEAEIDTEAEVEHKTTILDAVAEELNHMNEQPQEYKDAALAIVASVINNIDLLAKSSNSDTSDEVFQTRNSLKNVNADMMRSFINDPSKEYASFIDDFVSKELFNSKFRLVASNVDRAETTNNSSIIFMIKSEKTSVHIMDTGDIPLFYEGIGPYWLDKTIGAESSMYLELCVDFLYDEVYLCESFLAHRKDNMYHFLIKGSETYYFESELNIDFKKVFFQEPHSLYVATETDLYVFDFSKRSLTKVVDNVNTFGINEHTRLENRLFFTKYLSDRNITCLYIFDDESVDDDTNLCIYPIVAFEGELHDISVRPILNANCNTFFIGIPSELRGKLPYLKLIDCSWMKVKILPLIADTQLSYQEFAARNFKQINTVISFGPFEDHINKIVDLQRIYPVGQEFIVRTNDTHYYVNAEGIDLFELRKPLTSTVIRRDLIQVINIHNDTIDFDIRTNKSYFDQLLNIFTINDPNVSPAIRYVDESATRSKIRGHARQIAAYGEGVTRDFYTNACFDFAAKFLKSDGCFTIFNYEVLQIIPEDDLMDIGYYLHKWIIDMKAPLPIRLPMSLIWALTVNPKIEDLEYFAKMKDNSAFQHMFKNKDDGEFLEECGYESYEDCLKTMLKISDNKHVEIIARGFTSIFDIKNRVRMNMPTIDFYVSGPYTIDRKAFKKHIEAQDKKALESFASMLMQFIDEATETNLKNLLMNWSGCNYLIPNETYFITLASSNQKDIYFRTCSSEMYVNPKIMTSGDVDMDTIKLILTDITKNMRDT